MIQVRLYSREGCHLCDEAQEILESLQPDLPHQLHVIDVDQDPSLQRSYGLDIPVVEAGPYHLKAPFGRSDLVRVLGAAIDRSRHIELIESAGEKSGSITWTKADAITYWFSRHYVAVLNILVFLYVGLPILAPVLMNAGAEGPAKLIYRGYSMACHQLAYRSFFLFGEQPVYPRAAAGVDEYLSFQQATGLSEGDSNDALWQARGFTGNDTVGYKVALCERDVAIYGSILLFGLLFALSGRKWPAIPWYVWVLFGLVPIAWDGVSQLISQPPLELIPYRESTPQLRVLTGALFGFTSAWFAYPMVEESMAEARHLMGRKLRRIGRAVGVEQQA